MSAPVDAMFMSTKQAAAFVGLAAMTLHKMRVTGGGPAYRKLGARVIYAREDLVAWVESRDAFVNTSGGRAPVTQRQKEDGVAKDFSALADEVRRLRVAIDQLVRYVPKAKGDPEYNAARRAVHGGQRHDPMVYVVLDQRGRMKVGTTRNLVARLRTIRNSLPDATLYTSFRGGRMIEKELHRALKQRSCWIDLEWFLDCPEARQVVDSFKKAAPV